jgi:DNA topoisomerase-2
MKHLKTIEQQYQVLSELEHIRKRAGMYVGSTVLEDREEFTYNSDTQKMEFKKVSFIPGLIKVISEAIDNVVDEHKRHPDIVNQLKLSIDDDVITIYDNGGIPVEIHSEFNKYVPEIIFGMLRSGSNYSDEDEQALIGTNGLGVKLLNVLSKSFVVETADGSKHFIQEFTNGMNKRSEPIIKSSTKNFTKLTFELDFDFFQLDDLDADHVAKIQRRLIDVAACNPNLKVYFNGSQIKIKNFEDYVELYYSDVAHTSDENWQISIASSEGNNQTSFVNSVETYMGGTHVDYVLNQIVQKLKEFFKKKHKIDVKPADIKSHLHVFINCNINRPKYSSQSKENMISAVSDFGTSWDCNDKFIKKIINLEAIQNILDWVKAKEQAQINAELRKHNKNVDRADPKNVPKFHDATTKQRKDASLFLVEGDSALSGVLSGRNPKIHAAFPLRGKPINVYELDVKEVMENKEFKNITTIVGLQLGVPVERVEDIRFGKIVLTTDQDLDGFSIRGALLNMFHKFWPELFELGVIHILNTPLVKVFVGKKIIPFHSIEDFEQWKNDNKQTKFTSKYYKGLGTSNSKEWKEYFSDEMMQDNLVKMELTSEEDKQMFRLLFSKEKGYTDLRKDWLQLQEISL